MTPKTFVAAIVHADLHGPDIADMFDDLCDEHEDLASLVYAWADVDAVEPLRSAFINLGLAYEVPALISY